MLALGSQLCYTTSVKYYGIAKQYESPRSKLSAKLLAEKLRRVGRTPTYVELPSSMASRINKIVAKYNTRAAFKAARKKYLAEKH